jgi:hypothetical protein
MAFAGGATVVTTAGAAVAEAIKASGAIVSMEPRDFLAILDRIEEPLVMMAIGGVINKNYQYLVGHKGLAFYTKSPEKLRLPPAAELVTARRIWTPT